ncbi:RING-type E3 ubiquitin transferase, partial [Sarracenia purpurea var. burkii]
MVVLADPEDGCQPFASPPNSSFHNPTSKWIALIIMGNCSFATKIRNAQNANYHLALIYGEYKVGS